MAASLPPDSRQDRRPASAATVHALSFDVEEYFHVHAFGHAVQRCDWDRLQWRVGPPTVRLLELLRRHGVRATFFVLGWVAEKQPDLVRRIADDGHEIASHGYAHAAVHSQSQREFREDLLRASEAIHAACPGCPILGYRAPSFSIGPATPWAFEELRSAGFVYDSSVSPASLHDRYGVPEAPRFVHEVIPGLVEVPPATIRVLGQNLQVAGGGHFRLAPAPLTKWAIRRIEDEGRPAVTYLHPWEFDPEQPRVPGVGWKARFRHYVNLGKTHGRLEQLLRWRRFGPLVEVFADSINRTTCQSRACVNSSDGRPDPHEPKAVVRA